MRELALFLEVSHEQPDAAVAPHVPHTPPQRKRGRPGAQEVLLETADWLQEHRSEIYEKQPGNQKLRYFCKICQVSICFHRRHSLKFVLDHEKSAKHSRQQGEVDTLVSNDYKKSAGRCSGIMLNAVGHPLFNICQSVQIWMEAGQPQIKTLEGESPQLLDLLAFQADVAGNVCARSPQCTSQVEQEGLCHPCHAAVHKKRLPQLLDEWACKIDMARVAFLRFHHPAEASRLEALLSERGYLARGVAADMQELLKLDLKALSHRVNEKFLSVPKLRRSVQLQHFMDHILVPTHLYFNDASAATVHSAFISQFASQVASGAVRESDLSLACAVARGKLREDAVVHGLFQAFFAMVEKKERGLQRLCSSKALKEETIVDMLGILGKHKEVRHLFHKFGVSWRAPPQVPLQNERLPDFFCAVRDPEILKRNAQLCLGMLGCFGTQCGVILMDETVYRSTWELIGLRCNDGIIGGPWSNDPTKDAF